MPCQLPRSSLNGQPFLSRSRNGDMFLKRTGRVQKDPDLVNFLSTSSLVKNRQDKRSYFWMDSQCRHPRHRQSKVPDHLLLERSYQGMGGGLRRIMNRRRINFQAAGFFFFLSVSHLFPFYTSRPGQCEGTQQKHSALSVSSPPPPPPKHTHTLGDKPGTGLKRSSVCI